MPVRRRVLLLGVVAAMALTGCQGTVKAVTDLLANPAMGQEQFQVTRGRSVRLSWSVPSGQPADTVYTVVEHPTEQSGSHCDTQPAAKRMTTTASEVTLDLESGSWCYFRTHGWTSSFSVIATSGGTAVESARSNECGWSVYTYIWSDYQLGCGRGTLHATETGANPRIDAGGSWDSSGWDADKGFTGGTAVTHGFPALGAALNTSREGFTKYVVQTSDGVLRLSMIEPTHTRTGARVFDLWANGTKVAADIDIFAKVGRGKPYVLDVTVPTTDGTVELVPVAKAGSPIIATIEGSLRR